MIFSLPLPLCYLQIGHKAYKDSSQKDTKINTVHNANVCVDFIKKTPLWGHLHHLLSGKTLASKAVIPAKSTKRNNEKKWNGRIVFGDVMFVAIKKWSKKREDFCRESSMF